MIRFWSIPSLVESEGEMIEAIYRHLHDYYNQHIHIALKMPPDVYAQKFHADNGLHISGMFGLYGSGINSRGNICVFYKAILKG